MSAEETAVRTAKPKSVHGKMIRLARPYWFSYVLLGAAIFLSAWIPVGHAEGIRRVFNAVMDRSFDQLWLAAVFYGGVMLFGLVLGIVIEWGKQALNNRTTLDMQREVMGRLLRMPLMRFHQWHTGDKLQRLNDSAIAVQQGLNAQIPFYIEKLLSLVLLMGYLSILSWELLAGSMAIAIGVPLLGNLFAGPLHRWQSKFNESQSRQNADLQEQFQAMEVVKLYGLRSLFLSRWKQRVADTQSASVRLHMYHFASGITIFLGYWLGLIYVFSVGAWLAWQDRIEIGVIAAFVVSFEQLVYPFSHLAKIRVAFQNVVTNMQRVFEMTDLTIPAQPVVGEGGQMAMDGDIELRRVTFEYEAGKPVLDDFSLKIEKGKTTVFVGTSGSGKSTLLKLAAGLLSPVRGEIRIGDKLLNEQSAASWMKKVAYVPQNTGSAIFDMTVLENIRIGRPDASMEDVYRAAKLANADEFIRNLPMQYETRLGEQGQHLSGGERQRLLLARAFLRNPDILVLDEPTSSLDTLNQAKIQESLERIAKGRTVLIAAHRLSTARNADCIVVIENGQIREIGTHSELMKKRGRYFELIREGHLADSDDGSGGEGELS